MSRGQSGKLPDNATVILKVMVGSQAHGLATPTSDTDYKSIFIVPTEDFFKVGSPQPPQTLWQEGHEEDSTGWELGHFLSLATRSNPSVLECFKAPVVEATPLGYQLQELFPYVWDSDLVYAAFRGYGHNQRTKLFKEMETPSGRALKAPKFACAWLRTLYNATKLLQTGDFQMDVRGTAIENTLRNWRVRDDLTAHEVLEEIEPWDVYLQGVFSQTTRRQPDMIVINDFVATVRRANFDGNLAKLNCRVFMKTLAEFEEGL